MLDRLNQIKFNNIVTNSLVKHLHCCVKRFKIHVDHKQIQCFQKMQLQLSRFPVQFIRKNKKKIPWTVTISSKNQWWTHSKPSKNDRPLNKSVPALTTYTGPKPGVTYFTGWECFSRRRLLRTAILTTIQRKKTCRSRRV